MGPMALAVGLSVALQKPDWFFRVASASEVDRERAARVKETLLDHVASLTTWPSPRHDARPFVITLYGDDDLMLELLRNRSTSQRKDGRWLEIREVHAPTSSRDHEQVVNQLRNSHLIYVTQERGQDGLLAKLAGKPVLLVGNGVDFARRFGSIAFGVREGRIALFVNLERARRCRLKLSARLLQHARLVEETP